MSLPSTVVFVVYVRKGPQIRKVTLSSGICCSLQTSDHAQGAVAPQESFEDVIVDSHSDVGSGIVNICHSKKRAHFSRRKHKRNRKHSADNAGYGLRNGNESAKSRNECCAASDKFEKSKNEFINNDCPAACSSYCISPSKMPQSFPLGESEIIIHAVSESNPPVRLVPPQEEFKQHSGYEAASRSRSSFMRFQRPDCSLPQIREASLSPGCHDGLARSEAVESHQINDQVS